MSWTKIWPQSQSRPEDGVAVISWPRAMEEFEDMGPVQRGLVGAVVVGHCCGPRCWAEFSLLGWSVCFNLSHRLRECVTVTDVDLAKGF